MLLIEKNFNYMQLSFSEQIERGQDLQQIIRENELLRVANKQITQLIRYLIDQISKKMQPICPSLPQATADLSALDKSVSFSVQKLQANLQLRLQEQRSINLGLQQKIKEYQKTISEMSLIIQRIQLQLQDKKQENDALRLTVSKLSINLQTAQQMQLKWQSRYELLKSQMDYTRRYEQLDLAEKNRTLQDKNKQ